ncbi:hypothetical protein MKW98_027729 [Papaver atlanticum]|uniref:Late embryogenesis abundant protein LEA-2 subgroup domain-containing protein n=1 Tax=Papaver atlanticum TaxID=357466 RepID=A0AAD4T9E9_9MAGN|nr:hypothetical protein MKW98_027729 [Papaver atlanticum]
MMTEQQKIHPVADVEAPHPTAPLVNSRSARSEKGDPELQQQYAPRRNIPVYHSKPPKKKRGCCCKCICWTISLIILLIIIIAAAAGILYAVFQPKLPKYSIDRLRITDFQLNTDASLFARFAVRVTASNPNKKIGIYYEDGSNLSVFYTGTKLCEGRLPHFYQGHQNTTILDVALKGQTPNANALFSALRTEQQTTGNIPLNLKVKVPVKIKLGKLKLWKIKFMVRCNLVVDNISAAASIRIKTSDCKFRLRPF